MRQVLILLCVCSSAFSQNNRLNNYSNDIAKYGQNPLQFVRNVITKHDLLIFDDALHAAYEPFVFYNQLILDTVLSKKINFVFLEVMSTSSQPAIDSFYKSNLMDTTILIKAFQDDYTGYGWRYQTYIDLLKTVWLQNKLLPNSHKIKVVCVDPPIYWEAIHSKQDYDIFDNSLKARDYSMYLEIVDAMEAFKKNKKALFITNTRHAYKNIRNRDGEKYWNTATFFNQFYPNKTYSIRIHNATLIIQQSKKTNKDSVSSASEIIYKWAKIDEGLWDSAFALNKNKPVAIPFNNTWFGKTAYVGNHMLNVAAGTRMYDAYDALIFLAPINKLHLSAHFNFIYTQAFKLELERRLRLLNGNDFESMLKEENAATFDEFFSKISQYVPIMPNNYIKD